MLFVGTRLCSYVHVFVVTPNYFCTSRWILMKCYMNHMLVKPTVHTCFFFLSADGISVVSGSSLMKIHRNLGN
jgi:hypothetical protein